MRDNSFGPAAYHYVMSHSRLRGALALTVASVSAAAACAAAFISIVYLVPGDGPADLSPTLFGLYFAWGLAATIALGLPAFAFCWYLNLVRWWAAVTLGMIGGMFVAFILGSGSDLEALSIMALVGTAAGFTFWVAWVKVLGGTHAT